LLKLKAQDGSDLEVISAQMQDSLIRVSDIAYDAKRRQFAMIANRFAWDAQPASERRRTGLSFEHVLAARRKGFDQTQRDTILSLLAISYTETDAPAGRVDLVFSAGHSVQLDLEYLDCAMKDQGAAWASEHTPAHE
jgi:Protein of unknown function (DUF2948)